jgi:hypothetical protein
MAGTSTRDTKRRGKPASESLPTLTASGERIDTKDKNLAQVFGRLRGDWQNQAWAYRELIGELGAGIEYEANIASKVNYKIGAVSGEDEPFMDGSDEFNIPDHVATAAREALDALPFRNGYSFTGLGYTCLRVTGEAYLHGQAVKGKEVWQVLSSSEVVTHNNGLAIKDLPGTTPKPLGVGDALMRLWKPHPQWKRLSDSPLRRMLDTCEDVVLAGRELRAAARSRVAANGLLLMPNELSIVRKSDSGIDNFQTELELLMLTPIQNEGDAGAVVPIVLRGPADDLEKVRHVILQREDSPKLIEKLNSALTRLREGMDMPPDVGQSVKDMNHWSAWSVTAENWKGYLEPHTRLWVDSLTEAYLRPSLMQPVGRGGWGLSEDEADLVQVWYDAGNVTQNANLAQDYLDLYDRGEVGGKALRRVKGAEEGDKPDEDEFQRMVTWQQAKGGTLGPEVVLGLLRQMIPDLGGLGVATVNGAVEPRRGEIVTTRPDMPRPQIGDGTGAAPGQQPDNPTPVPPPGLQAAATPKQPAPKIVTAADLMEIERALRERLMTAADDAVLRALEKAGTKVRAAAQRKDKELALATKGLAAEAVCPLAGYERIQALGLTEDILLAAAFTYLAGKFTEWTTGAIKETAKAVAGMLGLPLTVVGHLVQTMTSRIGPAWKGLESRLRQRALDKLYGREGDEELGEVPDTIVRPGDIRAALTEVGGNPPGGVHEDGKPGREGEVLGGLATGRDVTELIDAKADRLGLTWKYGVTPRARQFDPHKALNGERFTGWNDERLVPDARYAWVGPHFAPGDHDGCLCDYVPAWVLSPWKGLVQDELVTEAPSMKDTRYLAGTDDAAGRKGTVAQRTRDQRDRVLAVQTEWLRRTA